MNQAPTLYKIKVVSHLTDLSTHVIRAWEKRYGVVTPQRTETNRRLYTEQDVEKLRLLGQLTAAGHAISDLVGASIDRLHHLVQELNVIEHTLPDGTPSQPQEPADWVEACLDAISELDGDRLERLLQDAGVSLSKPRLLDEVVAPMLETIGDQWESGELRVAHEHLASAIVRTFLAGLLANYRPAENAPRVIVCTLSGQYHELGSLMVAVRAASMGWKVIYLGANMPADDIAAAVKQMKAQALALSLVHPPNDPAVVREIEQLRRALPKLPIIAGGRAMESYAPALKAHDVVRLNNLTLLAGFLKDLHNHPR